MHCLLFNVNIILCKHWKPGNWPMEAMKFEGGYSRISVYKWSWWLLYSYYMTNSFEWAMQIFNILHTDYPCIHGQPRLFLSLSYLVPKSIDPLKMHFLHVYQDWLPVYSGCFCHAVGIVIILYKLGHWPIRSELFGHTWTTVCGAPTVCT